MLIQVDRQGVRGPGKRGVIAAAGYADFDRDGDIDALMSPTRLSTSRTPMEFYRSGSVGTFIKDDSIFAGPVPGMVNARKMLVGDYNRDGWPDAFVIGTGFDAPPFPGEYPILLLSDGQGKLVSTPYTQVSSFQHGGASADIDHDGDLDIFVMSGNGTSYFLMNDGTGTFTYDSARVPSGGQDRFTAELVDVDGDGAFDLVTSGHDHEGSPAVIAWGDIDGEFSSDRQTTLPGVPCYGVAIDIEVEDLDGDGDRDIIVNRTSGGCGTFYEGFYVQVLRNDGQRTFTDATDQMIVQGSSPTARSLVWLTISDVNGDGSPDLIAGDLTSGLLWLNQSGILQSKTLSKTLVIYLGRSETLVGPIIEQFSSATGIKVEPIYAGTQALAATLLEEGDRTPADVFFAQDSGGLEAVEPMLSRVPDSILDSVLRWAFPLEGQWVGISGRARTLAYSTERLSQDDLPGDIFELTDPKWRGRLGWAPTDTSFQTMVTAMRATWGEKKTRQWLEGMKANNARDYPNNAAQLAAVASGEIDVGLVNHDSLHRVMAEEGDSFPARNYHTRADGPGAIITFSGAGILSNSDNKKAAEMFLEFLLSTVGYQYFASQTFEYPLKKGVAPALGLPPISEIYGPGIPLWELTDLEGTQALLREAGVLP